MERIWVIAYLIKEVKDNHFNILGIDFTNTP